MRPTRRLWLALGAVSALLVIFAGACGGDGDGGLDGGLDGDGDSGTPVAGSGSLTDPSIVPTATAWPVPPDPVPLDESTIGPSDGGEEGDGVTPPGGGEIYIVVAGDTAFGIALQFDVTVEELAGANSTTVEDLRNLSVGQELIIPAPSE